MRQALQCSSQFGGPGCSLSLRSCSQNPGGRAGPNRLDTQRGGADSSGKDYEASPRQSCEYGCRCRHCHSRSAYDLRDTKCKSRQPVRFGYVPRFVCGSHRLTCRTCSSLRIAGIDCGESESLESRSDKGLRVCVAHTLAPMARRPHLGFYRKQSRSRESACGQCDVCAEARSLGAVVPRLQAVRVAYHASKTYPQILNFEGARAQGRATV